MPNGAGWEQRAKPALRSLQGSAVLGGSVLCPRSAACTRGARGRGSCPWVPIVGTGSVTAARVTLCALGQGPTRLGCARDLKPQPHFSLLAKSSFRVKHGVWFYYYFLLFIIFFPPLSFPAARGTGSRRPVPSWDPTSRVLARPWGGICGAKFPLLQLESSRNADF